MKPHPGESEPSDDEFTLLVTRHLADDLDADAAARLAEMLAADAARREAFVQLCFQAQLLRSRLAPLLEATRGETAAEPASRASAPLPSPRGGRWPSLRTAGAMFHPMTLVLMLGLIAAGVLAYKFATQPSQPLVTKGLQQNVAAEPAAKVVTTTDAQWGGALRPAADTLQPGQRLVLQRGSAEILFSKQARVIVEAPAELVITDAAACRLDGGRLTAHVPEPARGFKVHTPDGTVTDLGTDFAVYVRNEAVGDRLETGGEEEQQDIGSQQNGKQPPITEVHVFKGQVDITPKSKIENRKSKILSAGQAVTISQQKVEPLPAADPFRFALDKLNGKPRHVLLSEDFESYDATDRVQAIGPWTVQSGTRKGQGIHVYDPRAKLAEMTADAANPVANLSPAPAIGSRVAFIAAGAENPRDTFPLLAREINGKLLAKNCQVLIEFDYMPLGSSGIQFSVALAAAAGHTPGIELWRDIDAAKKVDCPAYQWYRLRLLLDVADGVVRDARAERLHWLSSQGWVRHITFQPPTPKLDWTTPPRYAMFGFPVVSPETPAGVFWLDNVRMEVISE